jgi:hypothetical protein
LGIIKSVLSNNNNDNDDDDDNSITLQLLIRFVTEKLPNVNIAQNKSNKVK